MPAPSITWDLVKLGDLKNTKYGLEVTRGLMVNDAPIVVNSTYGADPGILIKCLAVTGFPQINDPFPMTGWEWLKVNSQNVAKVERNDKIKFNIVYGGIFSGGPTATWIVKESYTLSYVQTHTTSGGTYPLLTFYKKGAGATTPFNAGGTPPAGSQIKAAKATRPRVHRSVTATELLPKDDWDALKANYRAVAGTLNSATWNGGSRGTWLFLGPNTTTTNVGARVLVELTFLYEPLGWYAVLPWFNQIGEHPADSISEAAIRAAGIPALDDLRQGNGLTMASVVGESNFSLNFTFTF